MDRYDIVLDIIKHPDRYSSERIEEILSDSETREIYNLLCKINSAVGAWNGLTSDEIKEEWKDFEDCHFRSRPKFLRFSGRVASIAVFLLTSFVAVAIGVVLTVRTVDRKHIADESDSKMDSRFMPASENLARDSVISSKDSVILAQEAILFKDATLGEIIAAVEQIYKVKAIFKSEKAKELHLYYRLDSDKSLSETVEQLNTFKQINIRLDNQTIIID